ncbi:MAG: NAD(P)H-binding protein, partial [Clostridia bacterium]|nr:NAD(P)H-binding protein [Clostridia bacterium]
MKILVTGATGNVGQFVVQSLVSLGEQVKAAGTDVAKLNSTFKNPSIECVRFDFTLEETFSEALSDVDRVFLMRPPHLGKPEDLRPFIEAMGKCGIKLVSFLS